MLQTWHLTKITSAAIPDSGQKSWAPQLDKKCGAALRIAFSDRLNPGSVSDVPSDVAGGSSPSTGGTSMILKSLEKRVCKHHAMLRAKNRQVGYPRRLATAPAAKKRFPLLRDGRNGCVLPACVFA